MSERRLGSPLGKLALGTYPVYGPDHSAAHFWTTACTNWVPVAGDPTKPSNYVHFDDCGCEKCRLRDNDIPSDNLVTGPVLDSPEKAEKVGAEIALWFKPCDESDPQAIKAVWKPKAQPSASTPAPQPIQSYEDKLLADAQRRNMERAECGHSRKYETIGIPGGIGCLLCDIDLLRKRLADSTPPQPVREAAQVGWDTKCPYCEFPARTTGAVSPEKMTCRRCNHEWEAAQPTQCPTCPSRNPRLRGFEKVEHGALPNSGRIMCRDKFHEAAQPEPGKEGR